MHDQVSGVQPIGSKKEKEMRVKLEQICTELSSAFSILHSLLYISFSLSLSLWLTKFLFTRIDATTKLQRVDTRMGRRVAQIYTRKIRGQRSKIPASIWVNKGEIAGTDSWESSQMQGHLLKEYVPLRCIDNALTFGISQNICHNCSCWTPGLL